MPAARLAWGLARGAYHNPVEALTLGTGIAALQALALTLALTPLRRLTGWHDLARLRRPAGLWAFCYATLHLGIYVAIDRGFAFATIGADLVKRRFITAGMFAWLLLLPLALTSTRAAVVRLGRRWQTLHRLVYPAALAVAVHFVWKAKAVDLRLLLYCGLLLLLLAVRLVPGRR